MLLGMDYHQLFGRPNHQVGPVPLICPWEELRERIIDFLLGFMLGLLGLHPEQVA